MPVIIDPLNHQKVPRMTITNNRGVPFMVLFDPGQGVVEFWDLRYPMPHFNSEVRAAMDGADMPGQFTGGRYSLSTLIGGGDGASADQWSALNLQGGESDWYIDGPAMYQVRKWLRFTAHPTEES